MVVPLAPSVEIGAGTGHQIPMEIPGYRGGLLPMLKYRLPLAAAGATDPVEGCLCIKTSLTLFDIVKYSNMIEASEGG